MVADEHRGDERGDDERPTTSGGGRTGLSTFLATVVVVAVTLLVRCWARIGPDQFFSTVYDESVEYQAAVRMLAGSFPYQDFSFVHPPGSAILLLPFAALARIVGDADAMAAARALVLAVGGLNALVLCLLLRRYGTAAVVTGGLAYALYFPVLAVDRTFVLEPWLNLLLLASLALLFLRPWRRGPLVAGLLLGFSTTIKVWAFADAVVLAGYLAVARGRRAVLTFCAGYAIAAGVVCLPFFLLSPFAMIRHVVLAQVGRPEVGFQTWDVRFARVNALATVETFTGAGWGVVTAAVVVLATAVMVAVLVRDARAAGRRAGDPGWRAGLRRLDGLFVVAVVLVVTRTGVVLLGATFYRHYLAFPALPFCLAAGVLVGRLAATTGRAAGSRSPGTARAVTGAGYAAAAVAVAGLTVLTVTTLPWVGRSTAEQRRVLQIWAGPKHCVWGYGPGLVLADAATPNATHGCRSMVDRTGTALYLISRGHPSPPAWRSSQLVYRNPAWQRAAWREIERSDGVLLDPTSHRWLLRSRFSGEFTRLFVQENTVSGWSLWSRR